MLRLATVAALVAALSPAAAVQLADVITGYGLTESYNFSFPGAPLSAKDADNWILDKWSVNSHGISFGLDDMYVGRECERDHTDPQYICHRPSSRLE